MTKSDDTALHSYFQDGERWEQEILKSAKRSRAIAWLLVVIFASMTLLSLTAIILLVPLKTFEPYIVEVDKNTGYLEVKSGLTRPAKLSDQQAVTQANVVRYIRAREGYDPFAITDNFELAALLSTGAAARELQELYSAAREDNPAKVYGKHKTVSVDVKSVTFSNSSTALVRFSTTEKSDTEQIVRHFIAVVRYRYTETPATNEWRFENPLGFQVYNYRRDQETVTAGDAG
ncbi:virB8 family protein [Rhizobium terrae]|uniref:virB8 family protein n=1 Tax=Rhizobium terrae TaxID=2171756 RepID=UPI000E3BCABE|nr:type IV secretion system protein [Rhizobium terrae]